MEVGKHRHYAGDVVSHRHRGRQILALRPRTPVGEFRDPRIARAGELDVRMAHVEVLVLFIGTVHRH